MNELHELEKRVAVLEMQMRALLNGAATNNPTPFSAGGPGDEEPPPKP